MGFGVAVALLIDATIIRTVLLPSAMRMLGDRNWYLPRWLAWLPEVAGRGWIDGRELGTPPALEPSRASDAWAGD
jgi:RND superfamily putative drug exporter